MSILCYAATTAEDQELPWTLKKTCSAVIFVLILSLTLLKEAKAPNIWFISVAIIKSNLHQIYIYIFGIAQFLSYCGFHVEKKNFVDNGHNNITHGFAKSFSNNVVPGKKLAVTFSQAKDSSFRKYQAVHSHFLLEIILGLLPAFTVQFIKFLMKSLCE